MIRCKKSRGLLSQISDVFNICTTCIVLAVVGTKIMATFRLKRVAKELIKRVDIHDGI